VSALISIQNLEFSYKTKKILNIPALEVKKSETLFLSGPSGSGKTTLLGLLTGVLEIQKGRIEILGQNIKELSDSGRDAFRGQHIGYIFQQFNLIPYLNVLENITLSCSINSARAGKNEDYISEAKSLATQLGIGDCLEQKATELSVGQQQRVAAARAFLGYPELLIADEPTSSLDYSHREKFLKILFDICKKHQMTLLFVSHDESLKNLFDRVLSLRDINQVGE
jgi:putative ABC transport system ATP-binding protein